MDILFERPPNKMGAAALRVIGTMTRAQSIAVPAGHVTFGVRFRPGMAVRMLAIPPADEIVDGLLPFEDAFGTSRANRLHEQLNESIAPRGFIEVIERFLGEPRPLDPVEKALAWLAQNHGQLPIEELADAASLSPRQFRRICLERTGLTAKHLARVLRFRHASAHSRTAITSDRTPGGPGTNWAQLALDCGYYDQAHLINDFREFSGFSPTRLTPSSA
jgi:AraC-like DNA-binding protein